MFDPLVDTFLPGTLDRLKAKGITVLAVTWLPGDSEYTGLMVCKISNNGVLGIRSVGDLFSLVYRN